MLGKADYEPLDEAYYKTRSTRFWYERRLGRVRSRVSMSSLHKQAKVPASAQTPLMMLLLLVVEPIKNYNFETWLLFQ